MRTMTKDQDPRRQVRADTDHLAALDVDGKTLNVRVLDVTMTGARVQLSAEISGDGVLTFKSVRMGSRPARLVWREGDMVGLRFIDSEAMVAETRGLPSARHWLSRLLGKTLP